jgi:hypothetical protein
VFPTSSSSLWRGIYRKQFIMSVPLLRKICSARRHRSNQPIFVSNQTKGADSYAGQDVLLLTTGWETCQRSNPPREADREGHRRQPTFQMT